MARIIRHDSNVPVPVEQAQLIQPFQFGDGGARVLQQIGGVLQELGKRKQAAEDSLSVNEATMSRQLAAAEMKQFVVDNPDPETWADGFANIKEQQGNTYNELKMTQGVRDAQDIEQEAFFGKLGIDTEILATTQTISNDIQVSGTSLISLMGADDGTPEAAADILDQTELYQAALERKFTKEVAALHMAETLQQGEKLQAEVSVDNVKPMIEEVLVANDYAMKPANKAIDDLVGELQKSGTLNDVEAAEAKRDLSNWAADVAAQRRKEENQNAIQTQKGLADKLADGTYTGDDIALSSLSQTQKKDWDAVTAGARKALPAPSYAGTNTATQAILDYAANDIGEIEARQILIDERFKNQSISHEQYKSYLDKVEKKYPNHVASNISKSLSAAESVLYHKGTGFLGKDWIDKGEKDDLVKLNNELLKWIDDESEGGKYPTGQAIYEKVRELGVPVLTPSEVRAEDSVVIPKQTDPLYDPNDVEFDALDSGTKWYDSATGLWWKKR